MHDLELFENLKRTELRQKHMILCLQFKLCHVQQNWKTPVSIPITSRNAPIGVTSCTLHSIQYIPSTTQDTTPYAPAISTISEIFHSGCGKNDDSSVYTPHVHFCNPSLPNYSHVDGFLNVAREMDKP